MSEPENTWNPDSSGPEDSGAPERTQFFARPRTLTGSILNDTYKVDRLIGRGGMGEVYEGLEINTGERVAVKVILEQFANDERIRALFLNEARTLTKLSHPGLVQYRVCTIERKLGIFYMVTEFVDGPTLSHALRTLQHPSADLLVDLTTRIASALASAHEAGLVHRDISPDNILLPGGRIDLAKVIDFGIAKSLAAGNKTIIGNSYAGKLTYMSPEQLDEQPDGRSLIGPWTDIYALALMMIAVASGKPPPMGASIAEAVDRRKTVPDLSALPAKLRPVFAKMLAPDPAKRLRSMGDVIAALQVLKVKPKEKTKSGGGGAKVLLLGGSVVALAAVAAMGVFMYWPDTFDRTAVVPPPPPPITPAAPAAPASAASGVITVDAGGGGDVTTIAEALARAQDGQRIEVRPGRYTEAMLIAKNVTIASVGGGVVIDSSNHRCAELAGNEVMIGLSFETAAAVSCLDVRSGAPRLETVTVRTSGGVALQVAGDATPTVLDLKVEDAKGAGVVVTDRASGSFQRLSITSVDGHGFVASGRATPSVNGGQITGVQGAGILFLDDAGGNVQGVSVTENAFTGIELGDRSFPEIVGNTISSNRRSGVVVRSNAKGRVAENTVQANKIGGVVVAGNSAPIIESNKIFENEDAGIYLTDSAGGTVSRNEIASNNSYGIAVDKLSAAQVSANQLSKNKAPQLVARQSAQAKFENNVIRP